MLPDDPRHGTYAGHNAGCREDCCRTAARNYQKRRVYEGRPRIVSSLGVRRRIQALACLGWSMYDIARAADVSRENVRQWTLHDTCYRRTHELMDRIYDQLSMRLPPRETATQRQMVARTQKRAERNGWLPPLAWDDIDDPTERGGLGRKAARKQDYDEVVVLRLLEGVRINSTPADKKEAMRRWLGRGRSRRSLCVMHGWNEDRYVDREAS